MQTYLVGGAVRDSLLKYPFHERDWLVVGATVGDMLQQGYQQVGKDFPVFLHPQSKEEYALARTERKTAPGYQGFEIYASPDVTIEEDLSRRDLSINAIAQDEKGNIIDPYHGVDDLENKLLRHVSSAFCEDPVRILRVARFAARYAHLGFSVADETMQLMVSMVQQGEVDALVPERVWQEMHKALSEQHPEVFFEVLRECGALQVILPEIDNLFGVPQPEKYHPEIDTGVHTLLVLQQAVLLSDDIATRFAALCHDLGKALTPEDKWPSHYGHEAAGVPVVKKMCQRLRIPNEYRELALITTEFHLHTHRALEMKESTVLKALERLDCVRKPERFEKFIQACIADIHGRPGFENAAYPQADYMRQAAALMSEIDVPALQAQGLSGKEIAQGIYQQRLVLIKKLKKEWQSV